MAKGKKRQRKNIGNQGGIGRRAAQIGAASPGLPAGISGLAAETAILRKLEAAGYGAEGDVPVVIVTGDAPAPEYAGELIGEANTDIRLSSGATAPEGSRIYIRAGKPDPAAEARLDEIFLDDMGAGTADFHSLLTLPESGDDPGLVRDAVTGLGGPERLPGELRGDYTARPPAARRRPAPGIQTEIPAAFLRPAAARVVQALENEQEGLTARMAEGFTAEQLADPDLLKSIARAARAAGGTPGSSYTVTGDEGGQSVVVRDGARGTIPAKIVTGAADGGDDLPGGLRRGDIIAANRPAGYRPAGIGLPEGYPGDPGDQVWRPLAAVPEGGPEIIVTNDLNAIGAGDADLVIEDLDPDDPDDSGRVLMGSREQVIAYHRRIEAADRRGMALLPVPAGSGLVRTREAADAIGLRDDWTAAQVLAAHEWLARHYRDPSDDIADLLALHMRKTVDFSHLAAAMFWPVDLEKGADIPEGTQMARLIARGLGAARTFQVTAQMCRAMRAGWDAAPGQVLVLDEGLLPVPAGFAWLDAPWVRENLDTEAWQPVRAVSWERTVILAGTRRGVFGLPAGRETPVDAVRIVLWGRIPDEIAFGRWKGHEKRAVKTANRVGNLIPAQITVLPFGTRTDTDRRYATNGIVLMGLLHTLWKTLGETLPKSRPVRAAVPGGPRRAAHRTLKHDEVHIITLREYTYDSDPEPHHPLQVDWACRWWVEEFYRHIDHYDDGTDEAGRRRKHKAIPASQPGLLPDDDHDVCAVCLANGQTVRISYVGGFPKGPAGKPWRTPSKGRTVFRLAR